MQPQTYFSLLEEAGLGNFGVVSSVTYRLLDALTSYGDFFANIRVTDESFVGVMVLLLKSGLLVNRHVAGTVQVFKDSIKLFLNYANISYATMKAELVDPFVLALTRLGIVLQLKENTNIHIATDLISGDNQATLSSQANSTLQESRLFRTPSKGRWWEYESYNDFIVGFGSRYLLIDDIKDPATCAQVFWSMLAETNMVQLETSKGLYGADDSVMGINKTSAVNPLVRRAIGLVYIRSYLKDFHPLINQPYDELIKVTFKYESSALLEDKETVMRNLEVMDEKTRTSEFKKYLMTKAKISSAGVAKALKILRDNFGGGATYINHADVNEPNWAVAFWGVENYQKLLKLKQKYDSSDMFRHRFSIPLEPVCECSKK